MADVPLILFAGPIVRRVEPRLAAVWVALNQPRAVRVVVYDGRQQAPVSVAPLAAGAANTLRVGVSLHVAVVVVELKSPAPPLTPGRNYAYNLHFHGYVDASPAAAILDPVPSDPSRDLAALGLLKNEPVFEQQPHLALGYQVDELPSFALPPASVTDLKILHGSCRRPGFTYRNEPDGKGSYDALSFVDDLILKWRGEAGFDANRRPHQLFLTGDQIYADDVDGPMLPMLNRAGNRLLGRTESLPTVYPPTNDPASKQAYLGVPTPAGNATLEAFIAKHPTDALAALKDDRVVHAIGDPTLERKFSLLYDRPYAVDASLRRVWSRRGEMRYSRARERGVPGPQTSSGGENSCPSARHTGLSAGGSRCVCRATISPSTWSASTPPGSAATSTTRPGCASLTPRSWRWPARPTVGRLTASA